jgi:hypothetical protein
MLFQAYSLINLHNCVVYTKKSKRMKTISAIFVGRPVMTSKNNRTSTQTRRVKNSRSTNKYVIISGTTCTTFISLSRRSLQNIPVSNTSSTRSGSPRTTCGFPSASLASTISVRPLKTSTATSEGCYLLFDVVKVIIKLLNG